MHPVSESTERRRIRLRSWLDALDTEAIVTDVMRSTGATDRAAVRARVETFANEAFTGLTLLEPILDGTSGRILEIGSGGGFLARHLRAEGLDVTGVEPSSEAGFSFMRALDAAVAAQTHVDLPVLTISADALDPAVHGRFDLIYSVNVLEHVEELDLAFAAMANVLRPSGRMLHACPNYRIPYEPHLAMPLVPGRPHATRVVFARHVERHLDLWEGLNFITAGRLRRLATRHGLNARFRSGVMAASFDRLRHDPLFRQRHAGALVAVANAPALASIVSTVLRAVPATWQSPMIVDVESR